MANVDKLVVTWTGLVGPPGNSVFYGSPSQGPQMQPKVSTFFTTVGAYLPSGIVVTIPNNGETLDEATGKMVNTWSGGTQVAVTGTGVSTNSGVSGGIIRWETGQFANGRRVRGRTFLVPLISSAYGSGNLTTTVANALNSAASAMISTLPGVFVVYSRPVYDHTTDPPTLKKAGKQYAIQSTTCPLKVAYLSSRRD